MNSEKSKELDRIITEIRSGKPVSECIRQLPLGISAQELCAALWKKEPTTKSKTVVEKERIALNFPPFDRKTGEIL